MLTFTGAALELPTLEPQDADFITEEETGGRAWYEAHETHPTWPGGFSGMTIGDGFDCGYASAARIRAVRGPHLPAAAVEALAAVAGIKGRPAESHARELHWIAVPWEAARPTARGRGHRSP